MKPPDLEAKIRRWFPKAQILKQTNKKQSTTSFDSFTIELNKLGIGHFGVKNPISIFFRRSLHERF